MNLTSSNYTDRFGVIRSLLIVRVVVSVGVGGVGGDDRHVIVLHYHWDWRQRRSQRGPSLFLGWEYCDPVVIIGIY